MKRKFSYILCYRICRLFEYSAYYVSMFSNKKQFIVILHLNLMCSLYASGCGQKIFARKAIKIIYVKTAHAM